MECVRCKTRFKMLWGHPIRMLSTVCDGQRFPAEMSDFDFQKRLYKAANHGRVDEVIALLTECERWHKPGQWKGGGSRRAGPAARTR